VAMSLKGLEVKSETEFRDRAHSVRVG
jgi:hypothetical protein